MMTFSLILFISGLNNFKAALHVACVFSFACSVCSVTHANHLVRSDIGRPVNSVARRRVTPPVQKCNWQSSDSIPLIGMKGLVLPVLSRPLIRPDTCSTERFGLVMTECLLG